MKPLLFDMDDKQTYAKIKKDFRDSLAALSTYHNEWREYDDFYMGNQWKVQRAEWRPNPVVNYIAYVIDQKAPQITHAKPTGILYPQHPDDEEAAKIFTQAVDVVSDRCNLERILDEVVRTGLLLDIAWIKVYWDNNIVGGSMQKMNLYQGDVVIESVDPTNLYFDPSATKVEDCKYMIYATVKSTTWIQETWGVDVEPDSSTETDIYNRPILKNNVTEKVTFYEYWYKENGMLNVIYAAGNKILNRIEDVYKHGKYPFVPFVAKKNRKSILGISECRNLLSNQKLLNKLVEIPVTNALMLANPIMLVSASSGIDTNKITSKPGQVWTVRDDVDKGVRFLEPPTLGGEVHKLIESMTQFIERIGGIYDAQTGETPGGVTAASAIQLLQEQGSIPLKGITNNLYDTIEEVYEQIIELIKEFYTETRYLRVFDDEGGYQFVDFNALKYKEIDFDIKVVGGSSTPTSKAFVAQLGSDLFAQGLLLPSEYVNMLENLPNKERVVERLRSTEQAQGMAGMPMQNGQPMQQAPMQQAPMQQAPQPTDAGQNVDAVFDELYQSSPRKLQEQLDMALSKGFTKQQILESTMNATQKIRSM